MRELKVSGKQKFMNHEIPVVLGGFGNGKKCISDKTISEIHGIESRHVRERIKQNIKRFKENIDFIDLKQRVGQTGTLELLKNLGYAKQSITQAEHIYLLSERGYAKLIKIMDTDLAWEIHDNLIDEYFSLREKREEIVVPKDYASALRLAADEYERRMALEEKNNILSKENDLLAEKNLEWADRPIINALVRSYAHSMDDDYQGAWRDYKKELLYRYSINLNARKTA